MQFIVPATNLTTLIGFEAGTYPSAVEATTQSFLSTSTPQVSPVQSLILACNLVNNPLSNPSNLFYPFSVGDALFGGLVSANPNELIWLDCQEGSFQTIEITFLDQLYRPVAIGDTDVLVQLVFRTRKQLG